MPQRILFLFIILFTASANAQEITETNTDSIYFKALDLYKETSYQQSLDYTNRGLELAPDYHDIRILRIRNRWALEQIRLAGDDLIYLLQNVPDYPGVSELANRQVLLFKDSQRALEFINILEEQQNSNLEVQVLKASLYEKAGKKKEARELALELFSNRELNNDQRYTIQNILKRTISNEIGFNYQYINFSDDYSQSDSWNTFSGEYLHYFGRSAVIGRITHLDRNYDSGSLYEIEAYPVFSDRVYAFVNLGLSNGTIYPDLRGSASVFVNFLKSFELEAGGRLLHFSEQDYFTGIAGLTYYTGKFYLNTRAFIGPETLGQLVQNYQFNIRYYLKDTDNFIFGRLGSGISPDESTIFTQVQENPGLDAYYLNFGLNKTLGAKHIIQVSGGFLQEDLSNGNTGNQLIANLGYRFRF
ncbi:YaiO family outer membrane beta-barrel protein [Gramella sp. GC03-9]|uniref:YaiO family outer membrane beta-barrel protein n=1 Tax=Christiangramia oceanisediminis TaxID=2920386 RepID=A0A9X2KYW5_9FLAO|nr:YaiO family outer membrane beta-barrel protein [Gramella oceanisediminis]MCP9200882.1 YaiO family outer membrane beta-barrel protein [Gramella oceanisediminis]